MKARSRLRALLRAPSPAAAEVTAASRTADARAALLRESDAPGTKPDPVERRETLRSVEEAVADPEGIGAHIGRAKLEEIGFVAAIHDTRFWRRTGGTRGMRVSVGSTPAPLR